MNAKIINPASCPADSGRSRSGTMPAQNPRGKTPPALQFGNGNEGTYMTPTGNGGEGHDG